MGKTSHGPIFVVGMNGSGTTLLVDSLGQHKNIYAFPGETRVMPYFIEKLPKYGDLGEDRNFHRLWNAVRSANPFRIWNDGADIPLPDDWKTRDRSLRCVIDGIMQYFSQKQDKYRWCEKTPMHALHISKLASVFPEANFIHIIRDGRDCAASFNRRWGYKSDVTIYRWKKVVREARRQGKSIGDRYFELRYEDMTSNPELTMRQICEFIGEEFGEAVLEPKRPSGRPKLARRIIKNSQKWKTYFNKNENRRLESIAGNLLNELGYEVDDKKGDRDPIMMYRELFMFRDQARRLLATVVQRLKMNRYGIFKRISLIVSAVATGIKQRITTKY